MRVCVGSDEEAPVVEAIVSHLRARGDEVIRVAIGLEWPEVGRMVAEHVASGSCEFGVVCCSTGTGVSIAANKVRGVRAALCEYGDTAIGARRWNDANVLAISISHMSSEDVGAVLEGFLSTLPDAKELPTMSRVD